MERCVKITRTGKRCTRTQIEEGLCWQHRKERSETKAIHVYENEMKLIPYVERRTVNIQTGRSRKVRTKSHPLPYFIYKDIDKSTFKYKEIQVGTVLYRGAVGKETNPVQDLLYVTPNHKTAEIYSWNLEDPAYMKSIGRKFYLERTVIYTYKTVSPISLVRLDDVDNINTLRKYFDVYNDWAKATMGIKTSPFHSAFEVKEGKIFRFSNITYDFWFFGILAQLGFQGYYAGRLPFPKWLSKTEKELGEEIAICYPKTCLELIDTSFKPEL